MAVSAPPMSIEPRRAGAAGSSAGMTRQHADRDRDVDVEDPRPRDPLGDHAAEEHAGGAAGGCGGAVDGEGLHQLLRVGAEEHHQQRQCRWCDQRRAGALRCTGGDLDAGGLGEPGDQRCAGEDRPAGGEHAAGAEQVGEAAAEQQQAAEGDDVGVEDPREVSGAEAEVRADLGEGDADDRGVHDHHELRERDEAERGPAPRICGLHGCSFPSRRSRLNDEDRGPGAAQRSGLPGRGGASQAPEVRWAAHGSTIPIGGITKSAASRTRPRP